MTEKFRSKNEQITHCALKKLYPNTRIEQEYYIGCGLHLDFLVHSTVKVGVEVDGAQHYSFNSFFHECLADFERQKDLDLTKEELCRKNGITLIRLDASRGLQPAQVASEILRQLGETEYVTTGEFKELEKKRKAIRSDYNRKSYRNYKEWRKGK